MTPESVLEAMRAELTRLARRVDELETRLAAHEAGPALDRGGQDLPAPAPGAATDSITEEEMLAISAAVAAYLGVRARVRQVRLIRSDAWAQVGRVSIQSSHSLH
jgi:methylmalonyl-CoA carboxyltransferase large subunit